MTEHQEQQALFMWLEVMANRYPILDLAFAIPNGGKRHIAVARKLKAEGVKAGVPDIFLPAPNGQYNGLFVEMKSAKGQPTKAQKQWIFALNEVGYQAVVARGWEHAANIIADYLHLPESVKP
jgi:hypothetical protein